VNFAEFISKLSYRLANYPLPGHEEIVKKMSPNRMRLKGEPNETTRKSGVLILFYPKGEDIYLPLILRPQYDGVHGGQMAFPGGRAELKDKNIQATALREAQEEIGIKASDVKIIGNLTELYINPSNLLCQPVLGYMNYRPDFYPDAREVADILEVPLSDFVNPDTVQTRQVEARGYKFETPGFIIQEQIVWGATAMMVAELIDIIKDIE
jgi:8-oxo-dGTP pyrophosphatase MutT (NUDIX family)